jgi:hypothetical protein
MAPPFYRGLPRENAAPGPEDSGEGPLLGGFHRIAAAPRLPINGLLDGRSHALPHADGIEGIQLLTGLAIAFDKPVLPRVLRLVRRREAGKAGDTSSAVSATRVRVILRP